MNHPSSLHEDKSFGLSDIGLSRANNEDVWLSLPEYGFYALADGMGGHRAGEVAAHTTIEALSHSIRSFYSLFSQSCPEIAIALRGAIEQANRKVYELSRSSDSFTGMGTTLCCLLRTADAVIYAHVGDSRIYRLRNGKLTALTRDHSLFARWLSLGKRAEECETPYPYKNVITRAIGTSKKANPEIAVSTIEPGDLFILCTDGLSDVLKEEEIEKILDRSETLSIAASRLIERAKIKGSHDNITVLLIQHPHATTDLPRQQLDDSARPKSAPSDASGPERASGQPL